MTSRLDGTRNGAPPSAPGHPASPARPRARWIGSLGYHAAAVLVAALFLVPLVWMVSASLRQTGLPPPREIEWIPSPIAWENYARLFDLLPFGRYILKSAIISLAAVPLTLLTASWAGFGMSQLGPRARNRLLILSIGLLMVPITALWLTRFVLFKAAGLVDSYTALIAPALMGSSPFFILLFYWAFRRIPSELFDSARLDGASALSIWRHIAFPLARATVVAVGTLTFLLYWNDFINPLLYLKSQETYTLAVGVQQLQQLDRTNWPLLMAACVIMTAPALLVFFVAQRFFLQESRLSGIYGR
jgi:multiple sugar transport system permease protein